MLLFLSCYVTTTAQNNTDIDLQANNNFFYSHYYIDIDDTTNQFVGIPSHKHSFSNICGQALAGLFCAVGLSAVPFSAASSKLGIKDQVNTASAIITIAWYCFGAAVGVHWIAKSENPENSFWGTAASSIIGAGIGTGLISIQSSSDSYFVGLIAILSPIIISMIYASFIADWPSENQNLSLYKKNFLHEDLIEQSKIFDAELFRFNF